MVEVIVSFGTIPEVPAGYRIYNRHKDKLKVISYERKSGEWDDTSLLHRHLRSHELATADVIYVHVGATTCVTRAEAWLLLRRILKEVNGHKELIRVVTSFEGFEAEKSEPEKLGVKVVDLEGKTEKEYLAGIVRKFRRPI